MLQFTNSAIANYHKYQYDRVFAVIPGHSCSRPHNSNVEVSHHGSNANSSTNIGISYARIMTER